MAAGFVVVGIIAILVAVLVTQGGGGDEESVAGNPTEAPLPSASGVPLQGTDTDSQAIIALARKSVEVLPQGQWPSLYDDFTQAFRDRCTTTDFAQAGVDSGTNLGTDLGLLAFKYIQDVTFTGDTAAGTIVAEVTGKYEYQVIINFAKVDGVWKITPVADSTGCSAFSVLS